jgi:hypothetical protein
LWGTPARLLGFAESGQINQDKQKRTGSTS